MPENRILLTCNCLISHDVVHETMLIIVRDIWTKLDPFSQYQIDFLEEQMFQWQNSRYFESIRVHTENPKIKSR